MPHILLVDPVNQRRTNLYQLLTQTGYDVTIVADTGAAQTSLDTKTNISLLIGDLQTVKADNFAFIRSLQEQLCKVAILLISADESKNEVRVGSVLLRIVPVSPKERLLAAVLDTLLTHTHNYALRTIKQRLQAGLTEIFDSLNDLEQPTPITSAVLKIRDLSLDTNLGQATFAGMPIDLTPTQFQILRLLAESAGHIVTVEDIAFHVQGVHVSRTEARRMITAHLTNLRAKMQKAGCDHYLVNVRGRGYMLDLDAERALRTHQQQLELILDQLPIFIWTVDTQLRLTSMNGSRIQETIGLPMDEFIGMNALEVLPSDYDKSPLLTAFAQASTGQKVDFEYQRGRHIFHNRIQPLYEGDEIVGYAGMAYDITESKHRENHLRFESDVLQNAGDAIVFTDMDFRIQLWNRGAEMLYGWRADEVMGKTIPEILKTQYTSPETRESRIQQLLDEGVWRGEAIQFTKSGQMVRVHSSVTLLRDTQGMPAGSIAINYQL